MTGGAFSLARVPTYLGTILFSALQLGGIVVVFFGLSLIVLCIVTFFRIILPLLTTPGSLSFFFLFPVCSALSFAILFNYVAAATFRGPRVSADETLRLAEAGKSLPPQQQRCLLDPPARFCKVCDRYKAPREHHCKVCGRCVARMDHHCLWINNCVDVENHRYFFLFLVYLLLGTGVCSIMQIFIYARSWLRDPTKASLHGSNTRPSHDTFVILTFALCVSIFLFMFFFVGWNTLNILKNETQIEQFILYERKQLFRHSGFRFRNPYDLGRWHNFLVVFGTKKDPLLQCVKMGVRVSRVALVLWLVLPTLRPSTCDGVHYSTFDEEVAMPL